MSASTIPYHLRHHKAIERNLFINILKKLDRSRFINMYDYRYVGFGAPFLEDFKALHIEFNISKMDCLEYDGIAFLRQTFNNPYHFVTLYNESSTDYITGTNFKSDTNQIVWLDFASPKQLRQQLQDAELVSEKLNNFDVLKLTFNAQYSSFLSSHNLPRRTDAKKVLKYLKEDATYRVYLPSTITEFHILNNFPSVIRAMATRAIKRGIAKGETENIFNHIAAFDYADGQLMTTITGIISTQEDFANISRESGLIIWEFYDIEPKDELIIGNEIRVPTMTISERIEIDKYMPANNITKVATSLKFQYDADVNENKKLLEGYNKYYKYLPYYSRVTY